MDSLKKLNLAVLCLVFLFSLGYIGQAGSSNGIDYFTKSKDKNNSKSEAKREALWREGADPARCKRL